MATGDAQGPFCPWGADKKSEKIQVDDPHAVSKISPKRKTRLHHSVSAHDLRYRDIEKEKLDVRSPRGVLEACLETFEPDADVSENNSKELVVPW